MSMNHLVNLNNEESFGNMNIANHENGAFESPHLFMNYATASFSYPSPQSIVCFEASESSHILNFGINGHVEAFSDITQILETEAFPNHEFTIAQGVNGGSYICIYGFISDFSIGGIEQGVDNICSENYTFDHCLGANFVLETDCTGTDEVAISIDFDPNYEALNNDFFDVFFGDDFIGFYAFDDLPIIIPGINTNNALGVPIRIQENDNPECAYLDEIIWPDCSPNECSITDLVVEQLGCNENNGTYLFHLDFNYNPNSGQDSFYVEINGIPYGEGYSNESLPITIELESTPGAVLHFLVYDTLLDDCAEDTNIEVQSCQPTCFYANVQAGECHSTGQADLIINNVEAFSNTGIYSVFLNDEHLENLEYSDFPITFPSVIANNQSENIVTIYWGDENTECVQEYSVYNECDACIYDISLSPTECENGFYFINVNFQSNITSEDFFVTLDNDQVFGPFHYEDRPYSVGPVDGSVFHETPISISTLDGECSAESAIVYGCADPCFVAEVSAGECQASGYAALEIDLIFLSDAIDNGPFEVVLNDESLGAFGLDDFPLYLPETLAPNSENFILITETSTECIYSTELINHCGDECFEGIVELGECHNDGSADLWVNINQTVNPGPFIIQVNGETVGIYELSQFPLNLFSVIPAVASNEVSIRRDGSDCIEFYQIINECLPPNECNFSEIFAEAHSCDGDQFLVDVEFHNPTGGDLGFYIFGDGMIFGPYEYGQTFYTFGPLSGNNPNHTVLLLDIADPSCFGNYNFTYSCTDECNIEAVIASTSECTDDGTFFVEIGVEAANHGENFSILGNGNNYGTFNYNDLPVTLGPFEGDGETPLEFGVIDLENADCSNWTELISPNCQPCSITDFEYEISCGEESYELLINFTYDNPEAEHFLLFIGDEVYESFPYSALPLTLGNIPFHFNASTIRVEDRENELCGETIDFNVPCCNLGNLLNELEVTECGNDGEYYLRVHGFNGLNLSDSLVINYAPAGSSIIATTTVAYSDLAEEIGPLVGDGSTGYLFVFSDQDNDCSVTRTLEPVYCDNSDCVEFETVLGVFGPDFEHDSGDQIVEENEVIISYERNPESNCACNVFVLENLLDVDFGIDHILVTQNSGFGMNLSEVSTAFNTVNIDFYHPEGGLHIIVNGENPISANHFNDFPSNIATGVALQVSFDNDDPLQGTLTFSGNNIESIQLFSDETAAFDNICLSLDDNIWPGDTNTDNLANHFDLLNIGIAYGSTGPSRNEVNEEWTGLIGSNWANSFADGVNFKHADANGDGTINEEDQAVLEQNYGLEHGATTDFQALPYTDLDPVISLQSLEGDEIPNGAAFEIPIFAGTSELPINDIYGLAFTLEVDPNVVDLSSLEVIFPTSWFGEPDVNTIHIYKVNDNGHLEVAISRKDLNPVSGFGTIMYLRGIIDDILAISPSSDILLKNVYAIDQEQNPIPLQPQGIEFSVTSSNNTIDREMLRSSFSIFPNPTNGMLYYKNYYNMAADKVSVFNSSGQAILSIKQPDMEIDLSNLPQGVYFLKIHLQGYIFTERIIKLK